MGDQSLSRRSSTSWPRCVLYVGGHFYSTSIVCTYVCVFVCTYVCWRTVCTYVGGQCVRMLEDSVYVCLDNVHMPK